MICGTFNWFLNDYILKGKPGNNEPYEKVTWSNTGILICTPGLSIFPSIGDLDESNVYKYI